MRVSPCQLLRQEHRSIQLHHVSLVVAEGLERQGFQLPTVEEYSLPQGVEVEVRQHQIGEAVERIQKDWHHIH